MMKTRYRIAAIVLIAGCLVSCGREQKGPPNVLLISIDTLRPDRLGYEGNTHDTSPAIDALAGAGMVFKNNYSVAGWTLPAMATVLTGRYPKEHGATDFHWTMNLSHRTLADILRGEGYDTRGYVSHVILKPSYGFSEGFRHYDFSVLNIGHPHDVATARQLTDLVVEDLEEISEPYFIWVHYFDPHFEYLEHPQWQHFGNSAIDRYDQEIAHTDAQIARLISKLKKNGLYDNTIVVFTSDHGEEFGEHQASYHYTLHEEVMRVPLVIAGPGIAPGTDDTPTRQVDILPTLLDLLEIAPPVMDLPGRSLMAPSDKEGLAIFMERDRPPPYNQRGVIVDGYKLIVIERADTASIPETSRGTYAEIKNVHPGIQLYDLNQDPGEQSNIYSDSHPKARELLQLMAEHFSGEVKPLRSVELDENLRDKLRSLGYIR